MTILELPEAMHWTPSALERLPADFRYEVREGNLVVMAAAMRPWHADAQIRLVNLLRQQGRHAYIEQGVELGPGELRTCDVGVYHKAPGGDAAYRPASDFALLVEVVSTSSVREDRGIKPALYATAGVPEFWRVEESDDGRAIVHRHQLTHAVDGSPTYVETDVTALDTLEESAS
ncbi:Uma2 family endonuclease [Phytoactinopolyspora halotolerans]|uniref:Uma2 family endonuclease n=1 Tax=Phytoactinopolyspora halotolerans TaxID=1981512 RepID=A0A6L9SDD5_9ACTN|nr:Uma2 family endonuclease [Phytoactinopolyspora halotolerans]NEE03143.1 Uma2 family endonuclease [Phytoactinopolyspora halotolerans]